MKTTLPRSAFCAIGMSLLGVSPMYAQDAATRPTHAYVVAGYGTAGMMKTQDINSTFFASVSPIFLFQFTDKVIGETELEFELEEGATKTGLEYTDVTVLPTDNLAITAGKFLVPFGVFMQRLHPSWINRFTSMPPMFGHGEAAPGIEPLLPVVADIGVMASTVFPIGRNGRDLTFSAFVSNGPAPETAPGMAGMAKAVPHLTFGESVEDNNADKMIGARAGVVFAPTAEIDLSAMRASYGRAQVTPNAGRGLTFYGLNAAAEFRRGRAELRTEWMYLGVDAEVVDTVAMTSLVERVKRWGGYVQASTRIGSWEPVLRFSRVDPDTKMSDDELTQYGFGLNYYIAPSISIMAAFELNRDRFNGGADLPNNRALVHWAFGF